MDRFGYNLSIAYNELVDNVERKYYTERLRERRGVMTIYDFYSNILRIDCDTDNCVMTERQWSFSFCLKGNTLRITNGFFMR